MSQDYYPFFVHEAELAIASVRYSVPGEEGRTAKIKLARGFTPAGVKVELLLPQLVCKSARRLGIRRVRHQGEVSIKMPDGELALALRVSKPREG